MKILSGYRVSVKEQSWRQEVGEFASVRWSSGRDWDEALLLVSYSEGSYLPTAGNYEVGMNRGCDGCQPGV